MSVKATDIKFFRSTGNLGGSITTEEVPVNELHTLFDEVLPEESEKGLTDYRCIYIKNDNGTTALSDTVMFIAQNTPISTYSSMGLSAGISGINGVEPIIPYDTYLLPELVFTEGVESNIILGTIPPKGHVGVWLRRIIQPNSPALTADSAIFTVRGATVK